MSTFDIIRDAPGLLRSESLDITLRFDRTSNTTGRISWNIPTPAAGCAADSQAYCGMLITLDTTPSDASKLPTNGTVYQSDPTGDPQINAGDRLGTSMVIGAFYQDRTTTFMDVTGLSPNTPYYVSGYPSDCQYRYFQEGVHAYSLSYGDYTEPATSSKQAVLLTNPDGSSGVKPTDYTGLVPGINYQFNLTLGLGEDVVQPHTPLPASACVIQPQVFSITVSGTNAQTYQDLINELNRQFALITGAVNSPYAPNAGGYYWNGQQLFLWTGEQNIQLPVYVQSTAPNIVTTGTYWYNPTTHILYMWNGTSWIVQTVINYPSDPTKPTCDVSVWFDGTNAYLWNGNAWYSVNIIIQTDDPSAPISDLCGSYWYNTTLKQTFVWDNALQIWTSVSPLRSLIDPNTLPNGYFWFDTSSTNLYQLGVPSPGWNLQSNVRIINTAPTTPANGTFWYQPSTQLLFQWNSSTTTWDPITDFIPYSSDPLVRHSGDVWWNTTTDAISSWDNVHNTWNLASHFYEQATDPTNAPVINNGTLWLNPVSGIMYQWVNGCWKPIQYIELTTDPIHPPTGTVWYDGTVWHSWNGTAWVVINPTVSTIDPSVIPAGAYWFNTSNNTLNQWNGASWVNLLFSTTPLAPKIGTLWFDSTANQLKKWNGSAWVVVPGRAMVELNCEGNLVFTDNTPGSTSFVSVIGELRTNPLTGRPQWTRSTDAGTLWSSLTQSYYIADPEPGSDGLSGQAMYEIAGVGTDLSADERRKLANEIRYALGYPVMQVELVDAQIDQCITNAIQELRSRSAMPYTRGFFFMNIASETQRYKLTSTPNGYNKIVNILGIYRMTSAFLSSAHGAGVYGQIVLQQLYNMGTFDLLSYHLMASYVEDMEILFAARVTYTWNEQSRELMIHHRFPYSERMVLIEASVERYEQDIMQDRYCRPWLRKWALSEARMMLAEIRGKYSTLPSANGGVSLNASDLRQMARDEKLECIQDIADYVVDKPEEFGSDTQFIMG